MTLIKFNMIAQASGKINGTIFSKNASGQYMKTLQKPINRRSQSQDLTRMNISTLTKYWRNLTDIQREGWKDLALELPKYNRVGVLILRSGFNVFIEFNMNLRTLNVAIVMEDAPTKPLFVYEIESLSLLKTRETSVMMVDIALTEALPAGETWSVILRTTGLISGGRKCITGITKILTVFTGALEDDEISYDISDLFIDKYGRLPVPNDSIGLTAQLVLGNFPVTTLEKKSFLVYSIPV